MPNYHRTTNAKCRNCGKWRISGGHDGKGNTFGCKCERPDFPHVQRDAGLRMQEWHQAWATEASRVAKPGAYLLAFGGTRTFHRLMVALEDAGWIIRDTLCWVYASGFPKGRANLKPAWEPIVMARKPGPLRALAIDECRIPFASDDDEGESKGKNQHTRYANPGSNRDSYSGHMPPRENYEANGRWPANVVLTDAAFDGDAESVVGGGLAATGHFPAARPASAFQANAQAESIEAHLPPATYSRFFLIPKAARSEREPAMPGATTERVVGVWGGDEDDLTPGKKSTIARRNHHPTVKPLALMRHLVRLVTPRGGTVLDPFLGSGTTAIAAEMEGFQWIGIEREAEYVAIAEARLAGVQRGMGLSA